MLILIIREAMIAYKLIIKVDTQSVCLQGQDYCSHTIMKILRVGRIWIAGRQRVYKKNVVRTQKSRSMRSFLMIISVGANTG